MTVTVDIGKKEMENYYSNRLRNKKKVKGREFYDKVILSAPKGKCPYCTVREAKDVDHYLPQALYPSYCVSPINLIPSCSVCNMGKLHSFPNSQNEQTLHPYFDNIENDSWLEADLINDEPLYFRFFVKRNTSKTDLLFHRISYHFKSFHLNEVFSSQANEELYSMRKQLKKQYDNGGSNLKDFLTDAYESKLDLGVNTWRAVMYKALQNDTWFLNGCRGNSFFN